MRLQNDIFALILLVAIAGQTSATSYGMPLIVQHGTITG
jgi:hypothetical protein